MALLPPPGLGRWRDLAVAELEAVGRRFGVAAQRLLLFAVRCYRLVLGPLAGERCRFHPSCSRYAEAAILEHGPWRGAALAVWRLLRCHPWAPGGLDPVPRQFEWPVAGVSKSSGAAEGAVPPSDR